jgi:hypothetical protein
MEKVTAVQAGTPEVKRPRVVSATKFAASDLAASVAVAQAIHEKGGGRAAHDQLAAFLKYKSSNNGSYLDRVASARLFGLIEGARGELAPTTRALNILMPEYPERVRGYLIDAFMDVPLFRAVYDEYHGRELPPEFGLKNAMRTRFGITPSRLDDAYRSLMDSADTAGLFDVKGSRTQLIIPSSPRSAPPPVMDEKREEDKPAAFGGGGGDGSGGDEPPKPKTREDLQNEYVSTLIGLLREKGANGDVDAGLMERIEKLLDMTQ